MDQVGGIIWHITKCLCGCAKKEADYVYKLEENLVSLKDKWEDLQSMKEDLKARVDEAENTQGMQIAHEINRWLQKVDNIQQEITNIEVQGAKEIQDRCLSKCCPKNCMSSYKLGKKAAKMFNNVDNLAVEGKRYNENFKIAHRRPPEPIEMPLDEVVGLDLMFNKVWMSIEEENVGIIGLYGMGGVGKTTLLKKINNELGKRRLGFNFVMWVVVSKEPNLDSIMDSIREFVGIGDDIWNKCREPHVKAAKIYKVLKEKKFVLLLDDIWDQLDLKLVGVPYPKDTNFQSKVLFTTRLENVCAKMKVQKKFKVKILTEKEALELFCMKAGEETLNSHPNIPRLAKKMAKECKGLPLALIVLGSSMAGVSVEVWEDSMKNLTSSSWTALDLETKVFSILKYSYDKLDAVQKRCFLYCALYPEDYEILVSDLIDKWMWEKFLCKDMTMSVQDICGHGESIIEKLKLSCLLESVEDDFFISRTIKMHDMIRDMALWLLREDHDDMELVKRISITNDWESQKSIDPTNVTTLVLLKEIQHQLEDIKYMKRLKVLELHVIGQEFVDIGGLTSLEYLSFHIMDGFPEAELWVNLQSLTNLKFLSFQATLSDSCFSGSEIPLGVLSSLQQLRVFRLLGILISPLKERRILEELECLPNIEEVWINIMSRDSLNKLSKSNKLQSCLYYLSTFCLSYPNEKPLLSLGSVSGLKKLQQIVLSRLNIRSDQYPFWLDTCWLAKLRMVEIHSCQVTHVTWLKYAPLLQRLEICGCESMKEVIKEEEAIKDDNVDSSLVFSSLVELILEELPILKSIHRAPLPFPSLKSVVIDSCPKLEKLPFDFNSAKHKLTLIQGQQNWWDNLKWDDPTAKDKFQSKFKCYDDYSDIVRVCRSTCLYSIVFLLLREDLSEAEL
ncbi:hypothetical protein K1719_021532 [Acacia pycnantha]|nr:hypothetical protein K1719_021532 [Acacia pycnantha]